MTTMTKIKDTLSVEDTVAMLNGSTVGIFKTLVNGDDKYFSLSHDMCIGYYMSNSGEKYISPVFKKFIDLTTNNSNIQKTSDALMADIINGMYEEKWNRVYDALIKGVYNPLEDYSHTEKRTGNNMESIKYGSTVNQNGNVGTKLTTENNSVRDDSIMAFNSDTPVGTNGSTDKVQETVTGKSNENTSQNVSMKSGVDDKDFVIDETLEKSGRNTDGATLIDKELDMRNRQLFLKIVFKDIDSVTTLSIY